MSEVVGIGQAHEARRDATRELLERARWREAPVAWDDVVGHEPAKRELRVVAEQIRRHSVAQRLGLTMTRGILLLGPPGSGKTMLAKALATAVDRPAYVIPAGEVDPRLIRDIYRQLAHEPCILIWDEADVILRARWASNAPNLGRLVASFCSALDGVESVSGPVTVALTAEREHYLDPSALRAGRLTTKVLLEVPNNAERRELWSRAIGRVPVAETIDLTRVAERSVGMTGADIVAAVMVALGLSMVEGHDALTSSLLDEALLRRHHVTERARPLADVRRTAVHEAGHAIVAALQLGPGALSSVSLRVSGSSVGRTELVDEWADDARLDRAGLGRVAKVAYGGLVAEELVFGPSHVGQGVVADISRATSIVRRRAVDSGAARDLGVVDLDELERGQLSDRGADAMRVALWEHVRAEVATLLDEVRGLMRDRVGQVEGLAMHVLEAQDQTLSGESLVAALSAVGIDRVEVEEGV